MNGRLEGEQPYLVDLLTLTMVINHLLTGMILQVPSRELTTYRTKRHISSKKSSTQKCRKR